MNSIAMKCPAKLNLNLSILSKRIDGMHEINTQFQLINLFDDMLIKKTSNKNINVKTNASLSIDGKKNIVFKAIEALSEYTGKEISCDVNIEKNIPIGGGLGGGSSNAAAALIGTNVLFQLGLSSENLREIGVKLGADVPFFIYGKNAHATGIGDQFLEEKSINKKKYLLLFPLVESSTQELFREWDKLSRHDQEMIGENEENSFLPLFLDKYKEVNIVFNDLVKMNNPRLSGTGSTIFYEYSDNDDIKKTLKKIPSKWRHSFCEPLQCSPLLTYLT